MNKIIQFFKSLSPFKSFFQYIIQRIIGSYIKTSINYNSFFTGSCNLKDLELNSKKINNEILKNSPFIIKTGIIKNFKINIPWTNILTQSIEIYIEDIEILFICNRNYQNSDKKTYNTQNIKETDNINEYYKEDDIQNDVFIKIVNKILLNMKIICKNLVFKLLFPKNNNKFLALKFETISILKQKVNFKENIKKNKNDTDLIDYYIYISNFKIFLQGFFTKKNPNEEIIYMLGHVKKSSHIDENSIKIHLKLKKIEDSYEYLSINLPLQELIIEPNKIRIFISIFSELLDFFNFLPKKTNTISDDNQIDELLKDDLLKTEEKNTINNDLDLSKYIKFNYVQKNTEVITSITEKINIENNYFINSEKSEKSTLMISEKIKKNSQIEKIISINEKNDCLKSVINEYFVSCIQFKDNFDNEEKLHEEDQIILKEFIESNLSIKKSVEINDIINKNKEKLKIKMKKMIFCFFKEQFENENKFSFYENVKKYKFNYINEKNQFVLYIENLFVKSEELGFENFQIKIKKINFLNIFFNQNENETKNDDSFYSLDNDKIIIEKKKGPYFYYYPIIKFDNKNNEKNEIKKKEKLNGFIQYDKYMLKKSIFDSKKQLNMTITYEFINNCYTIITQPIAINISLDLLNEIDQLISIIKSSENIINNESIQDLSLSSFYSCDEISENQLNNNYYEKMSKNLKIKFEIPQIQIIFLNENNNNILINENFEEKQLFTDIEKINIEINIMNEINFEIFGEKIDFSFLSFHNNFINLCNFIKLTSQSKNYAFKLQINSKQIGKNNKLFTFSKDFLYQYSDIIINLLFNNVEFMLNFEILEYYTDIIKLLDQYKLNIYNIIEKANKTRLNSEVISEVNDELNESKPKNQEKTQMKFLFILSIRSININLGNNLNLKDLISINFQLFQLYFTNYNDDKLLIKTSIYSLAIKLFNKTQFKYPYFVLLKKEKNNNSDNILNYENYLLYKQTNDFFEKSNDELEFDVFNLIFSPNLNSINLEINIKTIENSEISIEKINNSLSEEVISKNNSIISNSNLIKSIYIDFSIKNIIIKPLNLIFIANMDILDMTNDLKEQIDKLNNTKNNENSINKNSDIKYQIKINNICFDICSFKKNDITNYYEYSYIRSIITIDDINLNISMKNPIELTISNIKLFLLCIPNQISINSSNLIIFKNLFDPFFILNEYHNSILERFNFQNIFLIKKLDIFSINNVPSIDLNSIFIMICNDTLKIIKNHVSELEYFYLKISKFFNVISSINKSNENLNSATKIIDEKEEYYEIDLNTFKKNSNEIQNDEFEYINELNSSFHQYINIKINEIVINLNNSLDFLIFDDLIEDLSFYFLPQFKKKGENQFLINYFDDNFNEKNVKSSFILKKRNNFKNENSYIQLFLANISWIFYKKNDNYNINFMIENFKIFNKLDNKKTKILSRFKKNIKKSFLSTRISLNYNIKHKQNLEISLLINFSSLKILLNSEIIDFFRDFFKLGIISENNRENTENTIKKQEKKGCFVSFLKIEGFILSLNFDPNYLNLQKIFKEPIQLLNIGNIYDLEIDFKKFLARGLFFNEVVNESINFWYSDIKNNQKAMIFKKLPYLANIFNAFEKIKQTFVKWWEPEKTSHFLKVLIGNIDYYRLKFNFNTEKRNSLDLEEEIKDNI